MAKNRLRAKSKVVAGWENIAAHLGVSVATAKRKEAEGLPVTRVGGSVCAFCEDLNVWRAAKFSKKRR